MKDEVPDEFELNPELAAIILETLEHRLLDESTRPATLQWLRNNGVTYIKKYMIQGDKWLSESMKRQPEDEPISEQDRMFIWIAAERLNSATPMNIDYDQREKWIFGIMSLGYMLRIDHESNSKTG